MANSWVLKYLPYIKKILFIHSRTISVIRAFDQYSCFTEYNKMMDSFIEYTDDKQSTL